MLSCCWWLMTNGHLWWGKVICHLWGYICPLFTARLSFARSSLRSLYPVTLGVSFTPLGGMPPTGTCLSADRGTLRPMYLNILGVLLPILSSYWLSFSTEFNDFHPQDWINIVTEFIYILRYVPSLSHMVSSVTKMIQFSRLPQNRLSWICQYHLYIWCAELKSPCWYFLVKHSC